MSTTHHDGYIFVCDCKDWMNDTCVRQVFYKEFEGKQYCILHYPGEGKDEEFRHAVQRKLDDADYTFRGVWFPDAGSFDAVTFRTDADFLGAHFNGVARFHKAQFARVTFAGAKFKRIANFAGALFGQEAVFQSARFDEFAFFMDTQFIVGSNFYDAKFNGWASLSNAEFRGSADFRARFNAESNFSGARFNGPVNFNGAVFGAAADFSTAKFETVNFTDAVFNADVNLSLTRFIPPAAKPNAGTTGETDRPILANQTERTEQLINVCFDGAKFKAAVVFEFNQFQDEVLLSFAGALFEKPELAKFQSVTLPPHSFINVDPRKFNFIDARFGFLDKRDAVHKAIQTLRRHQINVSYPLLELAFRHLAVNAEENNRYEQAADLRYLAMEVKRLHRWRRVDWLRLSWWYWLLSGYGERVQRAFGALVIIWVMFAGAYWLGDSTWWQAEQTKSTAESGEVKNQTVLSQALTLPESLIYSGFVIALQKPEPLPANKRAKVLVLLETILGPLQAALLALAIRRKFMR